MDSQTNGADITSDVAVIGAGLAGLAVSIHLAKAGFRVTCFDPKTDFHQIVGESLDWSAPPLFKQLGFGMEELVGSDLATYKRHVILKLPDESAVEYVPSPWLGRPPLNIELRTLHIDRVPLHQHLLRRAAECGVSMIHERVANIEKVSRTIAAARTASGHRVIAQWFIDASGGASSFLGRAFHLSAVEYGRRKVAMWTYFKVSDWLEGTTLYADASRKGYMDWAWEIPVNPGTISVGTVSTGAAVKQQREAALSVDDIFRRQLSAFARFRRLLLESEFETPAVTSFTCRVYKGVCGPNWILIGEAASVPDPITGNGVTASLRHAAEAARLIQRFRAQRKISRWAQMAYNLRVFHMGRFFNSLIEKLAYDWPIRDRMGLLSAGDAYTVPAWSINQIYGRVRPDGMVSTALFSLFLSSLRLTAWVSHRLCRLFPAPPPRSRKLTAKPEAGV